MANKKLKVGNVPNLRFPGFHDQWEQITLGDCSISLDYGMNAAAKSFDGINKYIRITDIDENTLRYKSENPVSPSGNIDDKYLVGENDILFARTGASTGKSYLYNFSDGKLYFAGFLIRAKIKNEYNSKFIFSQFQTKKYDKWVELMSMRSGQPGINSQEYSSFNFFLPSAKSEQDKIASFILLVDERIQTQNKIIEELKVLKVETSKKIFLQKIKFKDNNGNNFPDWEKKKLREVLDYEQPTNYLVSNTEYDDSFDTPVVTAGKTFILGYTDEREGIFEKQKLPVIIFDDFTTATQYVNFQFKAKSSAMKILKAKNNSSIKFIFEAMQMINYEIGGHGRHWISVFSDLEISFPTLREQTKIADFLSSIDSKIDIENKLLQKLEEQKKFLLHQMFV